MNIYPHKCRRCNGLGYHEEQLTRSRSTPYRFSGPGRDSDKVTHIVVCDMCTGGQVTEEDHGRYLRSIGGPAYDRWLTNQGLTMVN